MSPKTFIHLMVFLFVMQSFCSCSVIFSNRRETYQHIQTIKENFVLVKLKSGSKRIKWFEDNDHPEAAENLRLEIDKANQEILKGMDESFDFTEYYFIKAEDAMLLKEKKYDEAKIYDGDMNPKDFNVMANSDYYFLSFDGVYETQQTYVDDDGVTRPAGGSEWFPGVAMHNKNLIQLIKPFPQLGMPKYKYSNTPLDVVIAEYNYELNSWYNLHKRRIQKFSK